MILIALVKVLIPAKLCACVETRPVDPVPANGMLSVCVDPEEENAGTVPEYPNAKSCFDAVRPLILVIAIPAALAHLIPPGAVLSATKIKLLVPTEILVNVEPAPTSKSPAL